MGRIRVHRCRPLGLPPGIAFRPAAVGTFCDHSTPLISWDAVQSSKARGTPVFLPNRSAELRHQKAVRFTDKGCGKMGKEKAYCFWVGILALWFSTVHAQNPQQIIQQAVNAE